MAVTISNAYISQFEANVRHLAQQGDARLRPHVWEVSSTAEIYNFDRLAASDAVQKTTRRTATPTVEPAWSRRRVTPQTWHWADTIEHADKVQMLIDPQSAYAQNGGMAMRRAIEDRIINAADADATDGAGNAVSLPPGQVAGAGTAGNSTVTMSLDLITEVNEKFQLNDVDPDEPKVWAVSPKRVREMLNIAELTSADYQAVQALNGNGMIHNFMGFTWVLTNRLKKTAGTNNSEASFAFTKKGIGLAVNQDIFTRVAERPDLSHAIQVYLEFTLDATRVEDEHVVVIHMADA